MSKLESYDYLIKILLIGNPAKESRRLVTRWLSGMFKEYYKITIGVEFYTKTVVTEYGKVKFQIWEMFSEGGRFQSIRLSYFRGTLGAIYIIDDESVASLQDLDGWLPLIQHEVGNKLEGYAFLLVKNIAIGEDSPQFEPFPSEKSQWFDGFFKCNFAKEGDVEEIFQEFSRILIENLQRETPYGLRLKGESYFYKKQYNEAIKCFKKALELNPEYEIVKKRLDELEMHIHNSLRKNEVSMTEDKKFKCAKCGEESPRKLQEILDKTQVLYYSMQGKPVYKKHIKCGTCGNIFERSLQIFEK